MQKDALNIFSEAQSVVGDGTAADVEVASTNVINDLKGDGGLAPANLVVEVNTAYTGAGKLQAKFQDSADGVTYADVLLSPVVAAADLAAGKRLINSPLPPDVRQYKRVLYVISDAALAAGKMDAQFTFEQPD